MLVPTSMAIVVFIIFAPNAKGADLLGIGYIANSVISGIILMVQGLIIGFIGKTLAAVAGVLALFLKFQGNYLTDVTIVRTSWEIFRDFANMFFILILVIIAFATIFDVQKYNWKGLMAKFLIAALLINFSLVISQFVINVATTLSNVMLNQFSDITGNLAAGLGVNFWLDPARTVSATSDAEKLLVNTVISSIGIIIVGAIALLSMASAAIFSIVRIPILWALMIISPLAWIAGVLPNTRQFFDWWKKVFIGWTFFLPIYLFALMMGVAILAGRPDLEAAAKMSVNQTALTRAGNLFGFAFQNLFYYVLTVIIMVWGLILSLKAGFLAGTYVNQTFGAINGYVQRKARVAGIKPLWERVKKEGLPEQWGTAGKLYTGTRGAQKETAKLEQALAKRLGYRPDLKQQKQQVSEIDAEMGRLRDLESAGQLKVDTTFAAQAYDADRNSINGAAMRMLLYERGMIDGAEFQKDQLAWIKSNPFLAQSSAEKAEKGKYKKIPVGQLVDMAKAEGAYGEFKTDASISTRKRWYNFIKGDVKALSTANFDQTALDNGVEIFGGADTTEGGDFMKEVGKVRPDLIADYNIAHPTPGVPALTKAEHIQKLLKNPEDMSKIPLQVWTTADFESALTATISSKNLGKQRRDFKNRLDEMIKDNNFGPDRAAKLAVLARMP